MFLERIVISNYKALEYVEVKIDKKNTIVVGRNNAGKTSLIDVIKRVICGYDLQFDDYPLKLRSELYENIEGLILNKISYDIFLKNIKYPSVKFFINYNDETADQFLGNLSPFIIDLDEDNTLVEIKASYEVLIDKDILLGYFNKLSHFIIEGNIRNEEFDDFRKEMKYIVKQYFNKIFKLKICAVNPQNDTDVVVKTQQQLKDLFPIAIINAERNLDENGLTNLTDPFSDILSEINKENFDILDDDYNKKLIDIKEFILEENKSINTKVKGKMDELVKNSIKFGYPNADELKFTAETNIDISSSLINSTKLLYQNPETNETLPSTNNGLGYKNLIKIELLITAFCKQIQEFGDGCIPLLFIEEPESHMHPQLQRKFIEYLNNFISDYSNVSIQTFITTHSSYIVNVCDLSCVRYALKVNGIVKYKDLNEFIKDNETDYNFIKKFLKIEMCEIFFADKLILVEGTCERLLIPRIIQNMANKRLFSNNEDNLLSQYYSMVEIGGAHAFKFINFTNFLQIPTLILTDIDSVKKIINPDNRHVYKKAPVSLSEYSSNATINYWQKLNKEKNVLLQIESCENNQEINERGFVKLDKLGSITKTINLCHLEYQQEENGLCGRSLEESIVNVNREIYSLPADVNDELLCEHVSNISKTEFALDLLLKNEDFNVPSYIKNGLLWLDNPGVSDE